MTIHYSPTLSVCRWKSGGGQLQEARALAREIEGGRKHEGSRMIGGSGPECGISTALLEGSLVILIAPLTRQSEHCLEKRGDTLGRDRLMYVEGAEGRWGTPSPSYDNVLLYSCLTTFCAGLYKED